MGRLEAIRGFGSGGGAGGEGGGGSARRGRGIILWQDEGTLGAVRSIVVCGCHWVLVMTLLELLLLLLVLILLIAGVMLLVVCSLGWL